MNILRWTMGVVLVTLGGAFAQADNAIQTAFDCDLTCCNEPSCGCEAECCDEPSCCCEEPSCCCEEPSCCCESDGCCDSCGDGCCSTCCDDCCLLGDCCLGDAFSLKEEVCPCSSIDFGGWTQFGYHSDNARLSRDDNDGLAFNDHADRLNLHQQWFWAEKVAEAPCCGVDWGFRADIMYGNDASKTQSFGNSGGTWDNSAGWDRNGGYGWAVPQLYGEVAFGDWSIKAGHFYTLVGYEVVTAPDNFFYSHALTMFNSEPFTHTGVLATYSGIDSVDVYAGWTLGWDTGFDQNQGGSSFLGGFSTGLTDDITFTYIATAGNFGARSGGESGYSHSLVLDVALSDNVNYVLQSDLVGYDDPASIGLNDQVGVNNYLFYTVNDCLAYGVRAEWWKTDGESYYEVTAGLNYRLTANLVVRPEVRFDGAASDAAAKAMFFDDEADYDNTSFGVDAILTY